MTIRMLIAGACLAVALVPARVSAQAVTVKPGNYVYTAVTEGAPRTQGTVNASGIPWQCGAKHCTATGPWPVPGLGSCKALAKVVGRIRSYGHPARQLSAQDLEACNQGVGTSSNAATATPAKPVTAVNSGAPVLAPQQRPALATSGLNNTQIRQGMSLRQEHYATLQRAREQAAADARRREQEERERQRRANSSYGNDCDDSRRDVHPNAPEICDGRDNNCNGEIDEGQTLRRYLDADGDGHGDPSRALDVCPLDISNSARSAEALGGGWLVEVGNDCDDQNPALWRECP
jgi:hypothetical protein